MQQSTWFVLFYLGCDAPKTSTISDDTTIVQDQDGDGFTAEEDCNDSDALINPNAEELCDGFDNNCDGDIDEDVLSMFYADADNDGFGNTNITIEACEAPDGFVSNSSDCDDDEDQSHPGAEEVCDGLDNNCNDETDEDLGTLFYIDSDGDGFGDDDNTTNACDLTLGLASIGGDCNDGDAAIHPVATELCDEIDNNCNDEVDEDVMTTFYLDFDEDGYGDPNEIVEACNLPEGAVLQSGDCNDLDTNIYPGAIEYCDLQDNDCDGDTDEEDSVNQSTWYMDLDEDGYGDANNTVVSCAMPFGATSNNEDCDDNNVAIFPGAAEICNGSDDNCDGDIDESAAVDALTWYADSDNDGYGDMANTQNACSMPSGYLSDNTDCDDNDDDIHPGAIELCNQEDDDCDGSIDEEAADVITFYLDADEDGYGSASDTQEACEAPSGYVSNAQDCNDGNDAINVEAIEVCNNADDDCNGFVDDDDPNISDATLWYLDHDGDGYGDANITLLACDVPTGYTSDSTDCSDIEALMYPSAAEVCDGLDNNCDGQTDENSICVFDTCLDTLDAGQSTGDGLYTINPSGVDVEVYCDMTTDGGGWTLLTGALIQDQNWMSFAWIDGPNSDPSYYDMEWLNADSFWLNPKNLDGTCDAAALRATTTLPFAFSEWFGEWTAYGASTATTHHDDRYGNLAWGEITTDCYGHLKFGTDQDTSKTGGEWGDHWNGTTYGTSTEYVRTWSWSQESVNTTDVIRWESMDQGASEDVIFDEIEIWVR